MSKISDLEKNVLKASQKLLELEKELLIEEIKFYGHPFMKCLNRWHSSDDRNFCARMIGNNMITGKCSEVIKYGPTDEHGHSIVSYLTDQNKKYEDEKKNNK
jgi:hypothetical protein